MRPRPAQRALLERPGALRYETGTGCSGIDRLLELVAELGPERSRFGATQQFFGSSPAAAAWGSRRLERSAAGWSAQEWA